MHLSHLATILIFNLAAASPGCPANCGTKPCPAPSTCTTYTRTSPSSTLTTCIPAPTCLGVYRKPLSPPNTVRELLADEDRILRLRLRTRLLLGVLRRDEMQAYESEVAGLC
ncbi:hypothetical protein CDV55_106957 [Aspergillus turcosus]|nr:hypothetical protein CDV55_106957 [Aspergillus turcosus]